MKNIAIWLKKIKPGNLGLQNRGWQACSYDQEGLSLLGATFPQTTIFILKYVKGLVLCSPLVESAVISQVLSLSSTDGHSLLSSLQLTLQIE